MSSSICFNLDQSKILSSGNGLNGQRKFYLSTVTNSRFLKWSVGTTSALIIFSTHKMSSVKGDAIQNPEEPAKLGIKFPQGR